MVIGNGLIAREFKKIDHSQYLVFASGVSNSKQGDDSEYLREENLLKFYLNQRPDLVFIYFSTCSILDSSVNKNPYVIHKLKMESIVNERIGPFLIVRTSNLVGANLWNTVTIFNYLFISVIENRSIEIWSGAFRNLLDVEHLIIMVTKVIDERVLINSLIYLVNPTDISVSKIVDRIELFLGQNTDKNLISKGDRWFVDSELSRKLFDDLNLDCDDYVGYLLMKYYLKLT
jgi:dTDP-4-dehydrorhamnose reductase